jgi:hypothetical protein
MRVVHRAALPAILLITASIRHGAATELDLECPAIAVKHLRNLETCLSEGDPGDAFKCMRSLDECDDKADSVSGILALEDCFSTYSDYVASIGGGSCSAGDSICASQVADLVESSCTDNTMCPSYNSTDAFDAVAKCYRLGQATLAEHQT